LTGHRRSRDPGRSGFTLVETLATLALLCFVVAILGPLLVRVSRQSSSVTISQYRTAELISASSGAIALPYDLLFEVCTSGSTPLFPHTTCVAITDTLSVLRRIQLIVTPGDSLLSTPDTVTVYRVNSGRINPFDTP
jgi:prepilin-type N-terminal cleavage/methylation domain-containing protein